MLSNKYAPKKLSDFAFDNSIKKRIRNYLKRPSNLYMIGTNGVGKSSFISLLIANKKYNYLKINASNERTIDVLRKDVKEFIQLKSDDKKAVWFDEAGKLTALVQEALKGIMDDFNDVVWIFSSNHEIDIGLADRCTKITINGLSNMVIKKKLIEIMKLEKVDMGNEELNFLIKNARGSLRKAINFIDNPPRLSSVSSLIEMMFEDVEKSQEMYLKIRPGVNYFINEFVNTILNSNIQKSIIQDLILISAEYLFKYSQIKDDIVLMYAYIVEVNRRATK